MLTPLLETITLKTKVGGPGGPKGQWVGLTQPGEVEGHLLPEVPAHVVQRLVPVPLAPAGPVLEQDLPLVEARGPRALRGCCEGALGTRSQWVGLRLVWASYRALF